MLQCEQCYNYFPKKLWVFLDEINTCKSMGLISELMCKHTYHGKPLPKNIVFIAACNPYRHGKKFQNSGKSDQEIFEIVLFKSLFKIS